MLDRSSWPFYGALLSAGVLAVHQLRYLLAFGDDVDAALGASGHGYLTFAQPGIGVCLTFAIAAVLRRVASGRSSESSIDRRKLVVLFGVALLIAYAGQELIEGELAAGHTTGLAGIFGGGGWIAVPLAGVIGELLAFAVKIVVAVSRAAVPPRAARLHHAATIFGWWTNCIAVPRHRWIDNLHSGRAPPVFSTS